MESVVVGLVDVEDSSFNNKRATFLLETLKLPDAIEFSLGQRLSEGPDQTEPIDIDAVTIVFVVLLSEIIAVEIKLALAMEVTAFAVPFDLGTLFAEFVPPSSSREGEVTICERKDCIIVSFFFLLPCADF